MDQEQSRWTALAQLDEWLRTPMVVLSLLWLIIVVVELTVGASDFLTLLGTLIWIVFIAEFAIRLTLAPAKAEFLRGNWLTVLALLVPALRLFRAFAVLRAARALRGLRLVRIVGAANRTMNALKATLRRRGFGYVMGLTLAVVALGAAGMLSFEPASEIEGGFTGYGHAFWWTGMLVTTVGTDYWPATMEGRLLSALLAVYGLAVFGYVAATFASFFIGRDAQAPDAEVAGASELEALRAELAALRRALESRT